LNFIVEKPRRESDVDGSFDFVASEDPDLDLRSPEEADGLWYLILEAVLDGSRTY